MVLIYKDMENRYEKGRWIIEVWKQAYRYEWVILPFLSVYVSTSVFGKDNRQLSFQIRLEWILYRLTISYNLYPF